MDYIWANENDNFSVDVYFTKSPTPDCPPAQRSRRERTQRRE